MLLTICIYTGRQKHACSQHAVEKSRLLNIDQLPVREATVLPTCNRLPAAATEAAHGNFIATARHAVTAASHNSEDTAAQCPKLQVHDSTEKKASEQKVSNRADLRWWGSSCQSPSQPRCLHCCCARGCTGPHHCRHCCACSGCQAHCHLRRHHRGLKMSPEHTIHRSWAFCAGR